MTTTNSLTDLLLEIAHCPSFNPNEDNPCKVIAQSQFIIKGQSEEDYQVPEPWSGDLENAPILFLSSNPSISMREKYPRSSWPNERIIDFFVHRFGGGLENWTMDGRRTLNQDGIYSTQWVRYWVSARRRAIELTCNHDIQPGLDYALTEIVHCKSLDEMGVKEAVPECTRRYLERIVALSGAKIIVSFGKFAENAVHQIFRIQNHTKISEPISAGNRHRIFVFMPHPNARMTRSFQKILKASELERLRGCLREPESL